MLFNLAVYFDQCAEATSVVFSDDLREDAFYEHVVGDPCGHLALVLKVLALTHLWNVLLRDGWGGRKVTNKCLVDL